MASIPPQTTSHPLEEEFRKEEEKEQESRKETAVSSSMLESVAYEEGTLYISFVSGSEIEVPGTEAEYDALINAPSKGSYMWTNYPIYMNKGRELD